MAHRPLSTTKDRTGPLDRTGEYGKTTQFEEFPCTCEELTRHAESSVQKMYVIDSHIDANTYVILLTLLTRIYIIIGIPNSA